MTESLEGKVSPGMQRIKDMEYAGIPQALIEAGDLQGARGALEKFSEVIGQRAPDIYSLVSPYIKGALTSREGIISASKDLYVQRGKIIDDHLVLDVVNYLVYTSDASDTLDIKGDEVRRNKLMDKMSFIKDMKVGELRKRVKEAEAYLDNSNGDYNSGKGREAYMNAIFYKHLLDDIDSSVTFNDEVLSHLARGKTIENMGEAQSKRLVGA